MANERFRAYSFVDRITSVETGSRIRGSYAIPVGISSFVLPLAAEATGQLAAWAAMAAVDFAYRPVAGIAGEIELVTGLRPGQTLELEADLQRVDSEAISYSGTASVDGQPVLRLKDCLGPMVPMEDFDDPAAVRDRFEQLCGAGAEPGAFGGVPEIELIPTGGELGEWMSAELHVPESGDFFGDHFPRRPVFPGTLMMDVNMKFAADFVTKAAPLDDGRVWKADRLTDMKMRSFIPPGEKLETRAKFVHQNEEETVVAVETRKGKRRVSGGRLRMVARKEAW